MDDIIEDLFKVYLSIMDSYNSKIYQTVNDKYTIIDKAMIATYLFVKIVEDRDERNQEITHVLSNYLLRQVIYSETGNLAFEISDKSKIDLYKQMLDKLIVEKFNYKNRIMQKLKYDYKNIDISKYSELLVFLEDVAEFVIFKKMILRGNQEVVSVLDNVRNKIYSQLEMLDENEYFYDEKQEIISLIMSDKFEKSQYGDLVYVVLNLKDVCRYSQISTQLPENVLLHQYTVTIMSLLLAEYSNRILGENIDIYMIMIKSLFHDFTEYKGTEIITQFKNYNDVTKRMFAEIEENDEQDLKDKIGERFYIIISQYKNGAEGFVSEIIDKMLGIMKLWIEVGYFNNYTFIKTINSIYQDRFKRFLRVENIEEIKNKVFYLDLLREYYIYIKENLMEKDLNYFLKYFNEDELEEFRSEIRCLRDNPESFLK